MSVSNIIYLLITPVSNILPSNNVSIKHTAQQQCQYQTSYYLLIPTISNIPPSHKASCPALDALNSFHCTQVLLATDECSNLFLDYYAAMTQSVSTQLLQVRHFTSPEEYFCFPELVFIVILKIKQNTVLTPKRTHNCTSGIRTSNESYLLQS